MADVEKACDEVAERYNYERVGLSQRRQSMVCLGLPDRRYRNLFYIYLGEPRLALWFECKSERDRLSEEQRHFLVSELECGCLASCGGPEELEALILVYRREGFRKAMDLAEVQVRAWIAKGLRPAR